MKNIAVFIFCLLFLSSACAHATEDFLLIDSDLADYDGKKITLSGNVVIQHDFGTISANQVVLHATPDIPGLTYGLIEMKENVQILLKDGGQISCWEAHLNYKTLEGAFLGNPQQDYVVYTENCLNKEARSSPLIIKGRQIMVQLLPTNPKELGSPKNAIDMMEIREKVTVNYNHDFIAVADEAAYQRLPDTNSKEALPGVIMLKAKEENTCQLTNKEGDLIRAESMSIDTLGRELHFFSVNGFLQGIGVEFKANQLLWKGSEGILILQEDVEVSQEGLGTLITENVMRLYRDCTTKQLKAIDCPQQTKLVYSDYLLTCPGRVYVDNVKQIATLESKPQFADQILFEDAKGKIHADSAEIHYLQKEKKVNHKKIYLEGNVGIYNHYASMDEEAPTVSQYALAHKVEYTPETQEMLFFSSDKSRVLFFDKVKNMQVSAPGLRMQRDQITQKDLIQGMGDVRFTFVEKEFEQLKQKFSLLEKFGSQK